MLSSHNLHCCWVAMATRLWSTKLPQKPGKSPVSQYQFFLARAKSHYLSKLYSSWHQDILREGIVLYWGKLATLLLSPSISRDKNKVLNTSPLTHPINRHEQAASNGLVSHSLEDHESHPGQPGTPNLWYHTSQSVSVYVCISLLSSKQT
jgi:hypothetical protein